MTSVAFRWVGRAQVPRVRDYGGMGSGLGVRQRALRDVLGVPGVDAVWAVPEDVNLAEATVWRRAARGLVERGLARAVYRRKVDALGRRTAHLVLTRPESLVTGDALPLRSPTWVEAPPIDLLTFSAALQALMVERVAGQPVSARTAASWAQEAREALGADENVVTNLVTNRSGTVTNKPPQTGRLKASTAVDRT